MMFLLNYSRLAVQRTTCSGLLPAHFKISNIQKLSLGENENASCETQQAIFLSSSSLASSKTFSRSLIVTFVHLLHRFACFIFCLTSLFIDSIHSNSRNKRPLRSSMNNGRENS